MVAVLQDTRAGVCPTPRATTERADRTAEMTVQRRLGWTLDEIAAAHGVTRERARQVLASPRMLVRPDGSPGVAPEYLRRVLEEHLFAALGSLTELKQASLPVERCSRKIGSPCCAEVCPVCRPRIDAGKATYWADVLGGEAWVMFVGSLWLARAFASIADLDGRWVRVKRPDGSNALVTDVPLGDRTPQVRAVLEDLLRTRTPGRTVTSSPELRVSERTVKRWARGVPPGTEPERT